MAKYDIHIMESLPDALGNRGNDIYSRGTGNKGQILSGTGYKCNIGNMEHKKTIFDSWGTGKKTYLFQGNKGAVIPLGGSHKRYNFQTIRQCVCLFIRLSTRHTLNCVSKHAYLFTLHTLQTYTVICDPIP